MSLKACITLTIVGLLLIALLSTLGAHWLDSLPWRIQTAVSLVLIVTPLTGLTGLPDALKRRN
jgi:hypothetical protein